MEEGYVQPLQFIRIVSPGNVNLVQQPQQLTLTLVDSVQTVPADVGKDVEIVIPTIADHVILGEKQIEHTKINEAPAPPPPLPRPSVNCLFCYALIKNYDVDKVWKGVRILRKTSTRLLEYIANHLGIELPPDAPRLKDRPPKESRLLPHNLPLCLQCSTSYYNGVYDTFVKYESAVAKLHSEIAECITKTIGASARNNEGRRGEGGYDILESFGANEHEVMKEVKRFRTKVAEKNPGGYVDDDDDEQQSAEQAPGSTVPGSSSPATKASKCKQNFPNPSTSSASNDDRIPRNLNIIKIVKKGPGQFGREIRRDHFDNLSASDMATNSALMNNADDDDDITEIPQPAADPSSNPLNCYAVSNPAPGVIQIIPMKLNSGTSKNKKKVKKRREPDYAEQRRNLYTCKYCNQYFPGQAKLNFHQVKVHGLEKPYQCDKCDARFIDKASVKTHMITHMDSTEKELTKKYTCHICGAKYRAKRNLEIHIRSHSNDKPFVCHVCGKRFTSKTSVNLCLDKHKGVKNHKCAYCEQTFLRREVLKIHERTHTGEKPYKCNLCNKAFAQRTPLRVHLKVHEKLGSNYVPRPPRNMKKEKGAE